MEATNAALVAVGKVEHRGSKKTGGYYSRGGIDYGNGRRYEKRKNMSRQG